MFQIVTYATSKTVSREWKKWIVIFTCALNKDFEIISNTSRHKEQFYSKLKLIEKSENQPISLEYLKLGRKCLSN